MEMTRKCINSPLIQEIKRHVVTSPNRLRLYKAAVACAILERTSGFEPSSETTAPRYLKLIIVTHCIPCVGFVETLI